MSWLSFSRTSLSKALLGWLDASLPGVAWELLKRATGEEDGMSSSLRFLVDAGVAGMFWRPFDASPNTRFRGRTVAAGMVVAKVATALCAGRGGGRYLGRRGISTTGNRITHMYASEYALERQEEGRYLL
jgi:hypothetical protein